MLDKPGSSGEDNANVRLGAASAILARSIASGNLAQTVEIGRLLAARSGRRRDLDRLLLEVTRRLLAAMTAPDGGGKDGGRNLPPRESVEDFLRKEVGNGEIVKGDGALAKRPVKRAAPAGPSPDEVAGLVLLARACEKAQLLEEAEGCYRRLENVSAEAESAAKSAMVAWARRQRINTMPWRSRWPEVQTLAQQLVDENPRWLDARMALGMVMLDAAGGNGREVPRGGRLLAPVAQVARTNPTGSGRRLRGRRCRGAGVARAGPADGRQRPAPGRPRLARGDPERRSLVLPAGDRGPIARAARRAGSPDGPVTELCSSRSARGPSRPNHPILSRSERSTADRLPAHDHVRFDGSAGPLEVGAGVLHVEADGVDFVARGLGKTVPGDRAGVRTACDSQRRFRDDPGVPRTPRDADRLLFWVTVVNQPGGRLLIVRPGNNDVRGSLDFEQGHEQKPFCAAIALFRRTDVNSAIIRPAVPAV